MKLQGAANGQAFALALIGMDRKRGKKRCFLSHETGVQGDQAFEQKLNLASTEGAEPSSRQSQDAAINTFPA